MCEKSLFGPTPDIKFLLEILYHLADSFSVLRTQTLTPNFIGTSFVPSCIQKSLSSNENICFASESSSLASFIILLSGLLPSSTAEKTRWVWSKLGKQENSTFVFP